MVRAGKGGLLIDKFKDENVVALGWDIGDLSNEKNSDVIKSKLREKYPNKSGKFIGNVAY